MSNNKEIRTIADAQIQSRFSLLLLALICFLVPSHWALSSFLN
ncbi:MAG: hypothetical protein ACJAQ4_001015 [Cryomorphaceae bacterium]|jgi:hypothetical protein